MTSIIRLRHLVGYLLLALLLVACSSTGSGNSTPSSTTTSTTPGSSPIPTASVQAQAPTDWTTYHHDNAHTGYIPSAPDPQNLVQAWKLDLDAAVYAEPLIIGNHLIVVTEGDTVYSLDPATGHEQWHINLGQPQARSGLPCGNIDPLGITGTPVYDSSSRSLFVAAEVAGPAHILVALDLNGHKKFQRSLDIPGMEPAPHQERGALVVANGMVYVPFGGLFGDCGNYKGRVIASRTDGQGQLLSFTVPVTREGGIWTPPGPAVDSAGKLYVSVGNGEAAGGNWDSSDSVLRLSANLHLEDGFAPSSWAQDNAGDVDLGSLGPVLLPNNLVFIAGKGGIAYTLHAQSLGGVGGQIDARSLCSGAYGGAASVGSQVFVPCEDGLRQVSIDANGHITPGWKASVAGSPIVGGHTVYSLGSDGTLAALNIYDGSVRTTISLDPTSRFATPTLSGATLYIGTLTGIAAIRITT